LLFVPGCLEVRIADDYDSMDSGLVYGRKRHTPAEALSLMNTGKGKLYDPLLLKAFFSIFA
jgi:response regulator RpfG family c-di-GMP phosphodiesterase